MTRSGPFLAAAVLALAAAGAAGALASGAAAAPEDAPALTVSVSPASLTVRSLPDWVPLTYTFHGGGAAPTHVQSREARFRTADGGWISGLIGPFPTPIAVPAGGDVAWPDLVLVPLDLLLEAAASAAEPGEAVFLDQSFSYRTGDGAQGRVTVSVPCEFTFDWRAALRLEPLPGRRHEAAIGGGPALDDGRRARAARLVAYADSAGDALARLLGAEPPGRPPQILIVGLPVPPHYAPARGTSPPRILLPAFLTEEPIPPQAWVLVTHELVHAHLVPRLPALPAWLVEPPASFLGDLIAERLGRGEAVRADREKFARWSHRYEETAGDYVGRAIWPLDNLEGDKPYGFGYVIHEILRPLALEHGDRLFAAVFRCLDERRAELAAAGGESERNRICVDCFSRAAGRDLAPWLARHGIH